MFWQQPDPRPTDVQHLPDLPDGLDTVIGERGAMLSGGQRQRIAIARALLKDAPVLVMDEAVSNLNTENEQALYAAMAEVRTYQELISRAGNFARLVAAQRDGHLER